MSPHIESQTIKMNSSFHFSGVEEVQTPALLINTDRVRHNILTTLQLASGNANRWRPHIKTTKLSYFVRMLVEAGVSQFKCATSLELITACKAGAKDVLVAYPMLGANASRVRQIAEEHSKVSVSTLVEHESQITQWLRSSVGVFIDVNPGMNRTGVPEHSTDTIVSLAKSIVSADLRFSGLHYYDGHLSQKDFADRCLQAHRGYERLMRVIDGLSNACIGVSEVITAGTPVFPCSLSFPPFSGASFVHRVSPGTVVYGDTTSLSQLPQDFGYLPAAVVMTRVVSHPSPGMITCDAGHKTVSADAGVPTCMVINHPELTALPPSEEHLPLRVAEGALVPAIGEILYLLPRHICPTVNNFDHAIIVSEGRFISVEPVSARGRERPMNLG